MITILFFLGGVLLSVVFSLLTIGVIRNSYRQIVVEMCGTEQRAAYWIRVSEVCLVVVSVFAAIVFHGYRGLPHPDAVLLFWGLMGQIAWILGAVFISLITISLVLLKSLPSTGKTT